MTDPAPEDLVPVPDDQVAFAFRMALKTRYKGSRGKTPIQETEAAETFEARRLIERLKGGGMLFYRRRDPGPPPTGTHMGSGPGAVGKLRP